MRVVRSPDELEVRRAVARRPVSWRRARARRRPALRRRVGLGGGDSRAHRAGGRPFRRLGLRDPWARRSRPRSSTRSAGSARLSRPASGSRAPDLQLALAGGRLYVLEANPRASRTVPSSPRRPVCPLVDRLPPDARRRSAELGLPERAGRLRPGPRRRSFRTTGSRVPPIGGPRCALPARSWPGRTPFEAYARRPPRRRPLELVRRHDRPLAPRAGRDRPSS